MLKSQQVRAASLDLALKTKSLLDEPEVKFEAVKDYCKLLQKLKEAEDVMMKLVCSDMMDDLMPIGAEAMEVIGEKHGGGCTCGRQGHK